MKDRLASWAYAAGWAVVRFLPEWLARRAFAVLADVAWRRRGRSVQRLEANLRRVVGPEVHDDDLGQLSRAGMRSYFRYWCEAFRLPAMSPERTKATFATAGEEHLKEALTSERGVILALPHMGNWDHAGAWFTQTYEPLLTVAERLKPESLYDRFVAFRGTLGFEVLPASDPRGTYTALRQRLTEGGVVCLLSDRDLTQRGVTVDFFGAAAKMPAGPAALALATGAALIPVTLHYSETHSHATFHAPLSVPVEGDRPQRVSVMTQALASVFESGIAAHPQDWHMLQRMWVADATDEGTRAQ